MIEIPRSRATIEVPMIPVSSDGDCVQLAAGPGTQLSITAEISYRTFEDEMYEADRRAGRPEGSWRNEDWINLRVKVRLV